MGTPVVAFTTLGVIGLLFLASGAFVHTFDKVQGKWFVNKGVLICFVSLIAIACYNDGYDKGRKRGQKDFIRGKIYIKPKLNLNRPTIDTIWVERQPY